MRVLPLIILASVLWIGGALSAVPAGRADEEDDDNAVGQNPNQHLPLAASCDPAACKVPDCRCSSTVLDSDIPIEQTPQLVMLTFDDAVTAANYLYVKESLGGRRNPDNCPAAATFFVSHEYTDYSKVHALWTEGHEIALHSITHQPTQEYWKGVSVDRLMQEFSDERELIAHFANMNKEDIKGVRVPLFQLSGNNSFEMIRKAGLTYDCSMPSQHFTNPGMWPYSLDYATTQDCPLGDCPTASLPGVWVAPILNWEDTQGFKCAMVDACQYLPEDNVDDMFAWMKENFDRHYYGNRAPFGVFIHAAWFWVRESHFPAYKKLIEYMNSLPDVYLVSVAKAIEFTRNPRAVTGTQAVPPQNQQPLDQEGRAAGSIRPYAAFDSCQAEPEPDCRPALCQLKKMSTGEERWMTVCNQCPAVYPWLGNPLGLENMEPVHDEEEQQVEEKEEVEEDEEEEEE